MGRRMSFFLGDSAEIFRGKNEHAPLSTFKEFSKNKEESNDHNDADHERAGTKEQIQLSVDNR